MKINQEGLDLIKEFEGCKLTSYKDLGGVLTIGYGHTGSYVHADMEISQEEAIELLIQDLKGYETDVDKALTVKVSDNQFSAMVCLCYNIGPTNFRNSTLLRLVNHGNFEDASKQFVRWANIHGIPVAGLLRRREAETKLFLV